MKIRRTAIVISALLVFASSMFPAIGAESSSNQRVSFVDTVKPPNVADPFDTDAEPSVLIRSRYVLVDFAALEKTLRASGESRGQNVEFRLFSDVVLSIRSAGISDHTVDEALRSEGSEPIGAWTWHGRILSNDGKNEIGFASLTLTKANGVTRLLSALTGVIVWGDKEFQLTPLLLPVHAIYEVDSSVGRAADEGTGSPPETDQTTSESSHTSASIAPAAHASATLDVLAIFTQRAKGAVPDIAATINSEIGNANTANARSQVGNVAFRLVGTREVVYSETNTTNDLILLRDQGGTANDPGKVLDFVHFWRDQVGADLVVMFGHGYTDACGRGFILSGANTSANFIGFAPNAFSVVNIDRTNCAQYVMAHEMGHNLSLRHDWDNDATNNSPYPYNHGHYSTSGDFRTVMSYDYPSCPGGSCARILNWSNPYVSYNGYATGIPEGQNRAAENYRALDNVAPYGAGWRSGPSTPFASSPYWINSDLARDVEIRSGGSNGYVLDGYGGIHRTAGAPAPSCCTPYWNGFNIARGLDNVPNSSAGITLDGYGGIHKWGSFTLSTSGSPYWNGWDIARGAELVPVALGYGGVTLDGYGGIHKWGNAIVNTSGSPYWGWDIGRDLAVRSGGAGGGYSLDGYGGIAPWGTAPGTSGNPYYSGVNWFRGMSLKSDGSGGFTIDRYGGIYPFTIP